MKRPSKKLFGYTWCGWLNIFLLQWFFIRLAYVLDEDKPPQCKLRFLTRIVPLTGWWSDYRYI